MVLANPTPARGQTDLARSLAVTGRHAEHSRQAPGRLELEQLQGSPLSSMEAAAVPNFTSLEQPSRKRPLAECPRSITSKDPAAPSDAPT